MTNILKSRSYSCPQSLSISILAPFPFPCSVRLLSFTMTVALSVHLWLIVHVLNFRPPLLLEWLFSWLLGNSVSLDHFIWLLRFLHCLPSFPHFLDKGRTPRSSHWCLSYQCHPLHSFHCCAVSPELFLKHQLRIWIYNYLLTTLKWVSLCMSSSKSETVIHFLPPFLVSLYF